MVPLGAVSQSSAIILLDPETQITSVAAQGSHRLPVCLSAGLRSLPVPWPADPQPSVCSVFGHCSLRTLTKYKVSSHPRLFPGGPTSSPIKQDTTHKQTKTLPPPRPRLLRRKILSWPMEKLSDSKGCEHRPSLCFLPVNVIPWDGLACGL